MKSDSYYVAPEATFNERGEMLRDALGTMKNTWPTHCGNVAVNRRDGVIIAAFKADAVSIAKVNELLQSILTRFSAGDFS